MDATTARLRRCFSQVFPDFSDAQVLAAKAGEAPQWDSLATLTLLSLIEEEFGVALDMDDFEEAPSFEGLLVRIKQAEMHA